MVKICQLVLEILHTIKLIPMPIAHRIYTKIYAKGTNNIPINDASFELSVFWSSDTESRINEQRFSDFTSLSFKTRLTSVTCFCGDVK